MYKGERTQDGKRMEGNGIFTFPSGDKYVGEFKDGVFHGEGTVFFSNTHGSGQFRAMWEDGVAVKGLYIFQDGLEYDPTGWGYCVPGDRRLWSEQLTYISPPPPYSAVHAAQDRLCIPDYATSDGIPPAFRDGLPKGYFDVDESMYVDGVVAGRKTAGQTEQNATQPLVQPSKAVPEQAPPAPAPKKQPQPLSESDVDNVVKIQSLYRGNRDRDVVKQRREESPLKGKGDLSPAPDVATSVAGAEGEALATVTEPMPPARPEDQPQPSG